jgi:hypothetical protein
MNAVKGNRELAIKSRSNPPTLADEISSGPSTTNFKRSSHQTLRTASHLVTGNVATPQTISDVSETTKRYRTSVVDHYQETPAAAAPPCRHRCDVTSRRPDNLALALYDRYNSGVGMCDVDQTTGGGTRDVRRRSAGVGYTRIDIIHRTSQVLWEESATMTPTTTSRPDVTQSDIADSFAPSTTSRTRGELYIYLSCFENPCAVFVSL